MSEVIEKTLYWLSSFFLEGDVDAHCQIGAPLNDDILITLKNDLFSVIEIRGSRRLMGNTEFETMAANLSTAMSKIMKSANGSQHSFGFGFRSSPQSSVRLLKEIFGPNFKTAKRYGVLDDVHLMDSMMALAAKCKEESIYLVIYTHAAGLSPSDKKRALVWREEMGAKISKGSPGSSFSDGMNQTPRMPIPGLIPRHMAARDNLIKDLEQEINSGGVGVLASLMDAGSALSMMRRHIDATSFDSSWRPRLIGGKGSVYPGVSERQGSGSNLFPMRIGRQLVSEPLTEVFSDVEYSKRGGTYYAGIILEVGPEDGSLPFADLAARIGRQIPWTVNIEVIPNGIKARKLDQTYASIVGAMGDYNKRVSTGWRYLKDLQNAGTYVGAMRVTFNTWASSESDIIMNLSFLKSSVESWGSCVVTNETGTPGLLTLTSSAGFTSRSPAPYLPGPIDAYARMMPMFPPASVWDSGQMIAHTRDGRPYPVGLGTTAQAFWGTLIFAPSGSGKSFLLNMINAGIIFAPGLDELPYLTVIDVGPSSRLVMDLARAVLPPHLARQVVSVRIRNSREFAVNPFDTQHMCDRPTEVDRDFQIAVVATICPGLGPEGDRFIGQVINEAYKSFGRESPSQRRWQASLDARVSDALKAINYEVTDRTFVWSVVDALFDAGRIEDSMLAQRHAVPRLIDLIKSCRTKEILDAYGNAPSTTNELILEVFTRNIQTAQNEYELISNTTRFDLDNAKIVSIDLEELVTGGESEEGKRKAALMFLFARRLGAKNYFLRWDEIEHIIPLKYQSYQRARITKIEESLKFLEYDEAHYATGIPSMSRRIMEDLRVGRKYKCVTMMASQLLQDFPRAAVDNCYTYFILGSGADSSLEELQTTFGLTNSEVQAVKQECTGPGRLFGLFKTLKGTTSQVLYTTAGPFTRWAYSTSKDDALLRDQLTKLLDGDYLAALKLLAKSYPEGSARDEMDRYRRGRGDSSEAESVISVFAMKMLKAGKS